MKKIVKLMILANIVLSILLLSNCKKDKDTDPAPVLEDGISGIWFKLTSENNIALDSDGYFWGLQIDNNGEVTVARLDYYNSQLNTEATGSMFTITKAQNGSFNGFTDDETINGTYSMGTISNAGYDYQSMNFYSPEITDYLPGGYGGDWSIVGNYIKLYNLDYTDASIGETEITTPPDAPTSLTFERTTSGSVLLEWVDNSSDESGFEIERREFEIGNYSLIYTAGINETSYTDNTVSSTKKYQYRVRAINTNGNSNYTNVIDVKGVPTAPWNLSVSYNSSTNSAEFTWWAKYSDDIIHFQFAYYSGATWGDLSFTFASNPTGVSNDEWQENGSMDYNGGDPWPSGTHSFKVKAVNSVGESLYSSSVDLVIAKKTSGTDVFNYRMLYSNN